MEKIKVLYTPKAFSLSILSQIEKKDRNAFLSTFLTKALQNENLIHEALQESLDKKDFNMTRKNISETFEEYGIKTSYIPKEEKKEKPLSKEIKNDTEKEKIKDHGLDDEFRIKI